MHIDWTAVFVALIAFIGSTGVWTLIDHRQQRQADRELRDSELVKEIRETRKELKEENEATRKAITELSERVDKNEAIASRIRLLKFADELFMDANHSKDSFDQCLSDITNYRAYCAANPNFKNDQTEETCDYILEIYHERMKKKDFARYGAYRNGMIS